jgi:flavin reductase (DIM6/NTAB) family NADH-FMN oxidoreductase RutF/rubredoxin
MTKVRKALWDMSYGLYIVTATDGKKHNGQIVNSAIQVTNTPPKIAVCINKENLTHDLIEKTKKFGLSILEKEAPMTFIGTWGFRSGRDADKFASAGFKEGVTGVRLVTEHTLSVMEAKITHEQDVGTHTIFVGEVVNSEVLKDGELLTYEYYQKEKKGKAPKTAPTYKDLHMDKYTCEICGYEYNPALGDPLNGIKPGTPFEKLPDSWTCPVCGASRDKFTVVS